MGTLTNSEDPDEMQLYAAFHQGLHSEDPDEMQQYAAFHQGLHCLLRIKQPSGTEIHLDLKSSNCDPLNQNGQPHTYCINMYGKIHLNTKG